MSGRAVSCPLYGTGAIRRVYSFRETPLKPKLARGLKHFLAIALVCQWCAAGECFSTHQPRLEANRSAA